MILTLARINQLIESLGKLNTMPLPAKYAFRVTKLIKKIEEELKIYNEARIKLFEQYAKKQENGQIGISENGEVQFENEDTRIKCMQELNELLGTEIEIDFKKIPIEEVGDLTFTASELVMLEEFFQE